MFKVTRKKPISVPIILCSKTLRYTRCEKYENLKKSQNRPKTQSNFLLEILFQLFSSLQVGQKIIPNSVSMNMLTYTLYTSSERPTLLKV